MGFYYLSILSLILIAVIYVVAIGVFRFIWVRLLSRKFGGPTVWIVVAAILIAPWAEELWVAWNFGQACKEAGTFIYKKVQVEGFYDDTTGWGPRQLAESKYRFMESRDLLNRRLLRVEPADGAARDRAIIWHAEKTGSGQATEGPFVVQPINEKEQVVVAPNRTDAWRVTTIDGPTARYHYKWPDRGARVAHKVGRSETVVIDTQTNEQIARYTRFGRRPSWFWIGLDVPAFACDAPGRWPFSKDSLSVYQEVLIPAAQ
jgi:hypothetical protein